jgi:hypothetical protein
MKPTGPPRSIIGKTNMRKMRMNGKRPLRIHIRSDALWRHSARPDGTQTCEPLRRHGGRLELPESRRGCGVLSAGSISASTLGGDEMAVADIDFSPSCALFHIHLPRILGLLRMS